METTHEQPHEKEARTTQLCAMPDLNRSQISAAEQAYEKGMGEGIKIGKRIGILLTKGCHLSGAIENQSKLIFFNRLKLKSLAGYLKVEGLLGVGNLVSQLDLLQLLGFEETPLGSVLYVDWERVKEKKPHHLFVFQYLLYLSREYAAIETKWTNMDEIQTRFCSAQYDRVSLNFENYTNDDAICSLTQGAIRRILSHVQDILSENLSDSFDAMLGEIHLPSLVKECLEQLEFFQ